MNHETAGWATGVLEPRIGMPSYGRTWVRAIVLLEPIWMMLAPIVRLVGATTVMDSKAALPRRAIMPLKPMRRVPVGA